MTDGDLDQPQEETVLEAVVEEARRRRRASLRVIVAAIDADSDAAAQGVPDRLLDEALTFHFKMFAQGDWAEESWQAAKISEIQRLRYDHPDVRCRAETAWFEQRTKEMWFALAGGADAFLRFQEHGRYRSSDLDPRKDMAFRRHIDIGAIPEDHGGWMPSELLTIACNSAGKRGSEVYAWALHRARQLYRDGFFANPFAKNPRPRPETPATMDDA